MIIAMDNWEDDLFLNLLINSKKLNSPKYLKSNENSINHPSNTDEKKYQECFQILQKHMKQSTIVNNNIDAFTAFMKENMGGFIGIFEKTIQGKID